MILWDKKYISYVRFKKGIYYFLVYLLFLSEESLFSSTNKRAILRNKLFFIKIRTDSNLIDLIIHVIILWCISKGTQIVWVQIIII